METLMNYDKPLGILLCGAEDIPYGDSNVKTTLDNVQKSIAPIEISPSTRNYSINEHFMFNGQRVKATSNISIGDTITVDTNCSLESIEESGGSGGILPHIIINAQHGDTVVVNKGTTFYYPVETESGVFEVDVNEFGTYTITINNSATITLLVDIVKVYTVSSVPDGSTVTPTDDIGIWLECGERTENYTTLSEILTDSTCLSALISNENACDYLVRSTTFATDIVADSGAMTLIGLNNYCADSLLADSTWLNAIANSAYVESVLNVKVPTMTSDSTPSGVVSASSTQGINSPYKAFDGSSSSGWVSSTKGNSWIQYMFTSAIKPCMVTKSDLYVRFNTYKIQGSTDGTNFTDLTDTLTNSISVKEVFNTIGSYQYVRLQVLSNNTTYNDGIYGTTDGLQFYGREDV